MSKREGETRWCFACGTENPHSLGLKFTGSGDRAESVFLPRREHQGYPGLVHGGIITTLLDEAMVKVLNRRGIDALTARLEVRFRERLGVEERVRVTGWLDEEHTSHYLMKGRVVRLDPEIVVATGTSIFMRGEESRGCDRKT